MFCATSCLEEYLAQISGFFREQQQHSEMKFVWNTIILVKVKRAMDRDRGVEHTYTAKCWCNCRYISPNFANLSTWHNEDRLSILALVKIGQIPREVSIC